MHESTQICIKHCQNGRMINKTHVDYLNAGMMCKLYVTFILGGGVTCIQRIFNGIANNIIIQHFGSLYAYPYDFHVRIRV